jgi:hypothetical protein
MLMRMLSAAGVPLVVDELRPPDEDNPHGYFEFTPVKALNKPGDKQWVTQAQGKAIKVISFLLPHLPDHCHYKIIFLKRRLAEVLASQKKMVARLGTPTGDISDEAMARTFTAHLAQVQKLLSTRANCEVLYIDHRDAIDTPGQVSAAIAGFLGEPLDTAVMAAEIDQSLHRNRA